MTIASLLFELLVWAHVATGFVGLAAFWVPLFARKGGRTHVQAGRIYTYCAYVVTVSAVTASAGRVVSYQFQGVGIAERPDLYGFAILLGYLGVVTLATVRQAMRVVATRKAPETLRTPVHEALAWASIAGSIAVVAVALRAWSDVSPILLGMSPIGLFIGRGMLRLMHNPRAQHMGWFYSHLARCSEAASPSTRRSSSSGRSACGPTRSRGRSPSSPGSCPRSSASRPSSSGPGTTGGSSPRRPPPRQLERRVAPTPVACRLPRLPIDDGDPGGRPGILHEAVAASAVQRLRRVALEVLLVQSIAERQQRHGGVELPRDPDHAVQRFD